MLFGLLTLMALEIKLPKTCLMIPGSALTNSGTWALKSTNNSTVRVPERPVIILAVSRTRSCRLKFWLQFVILAADTLDTSKSALRMVSKERVDEWSMDTVDCALELKV